MIWRLGIAAHCVRVAKVRLLKWWLGIGTIPYPLNTLPSKVRYHGIMPTSAADYNAPFGYPQVKLIYVKTEYESWKQLQTFCAGVGYG